VEGGGGEYAEGKKERRKGPTINNPRKLEKLYVYFFPLLSHAVTHYSK
jgi:hypothetical protein